MGVIENASKRVEVSYAFKLATVKRPEGRAPWAKLRQNCGLPFRAGLTSLRVMLVSLNTTTTI
jgi:hypothetical protein